MALGDPLWLNKYGLILKQGFMGNVRMTAGNPLRLPEGAQHLNAGRVLLTNSDHGCIKSERIVQFITNGTGNPYPKTFDLRPYKDKGHPGWVWELWEVKQPHWNDPSKDCRNDAGNYGYGFVNDDGILVGLKDEFESKYKYNGYMILSQGAYDCTLGGWKCECNLYRLINGHLNNYHIGYVTTIKNQ